MTHMLHMGGKSMKGAFRSIGINRNDFLSVIQMRTDQPEDTGILEVGGFCIQRI